MSSSAFSRSIARWEEDDGTLTLALSLSFTRTRTPAPTLTLTRWEEDVECSHQFMELVRRQLLGTRVFVFTEHRGGTRILN